MADFTFSYLFMDLSFLVIWIILFWWRKDVRKEMLGLSIIMGAMAPFAELVYLLDWWVPLTITGTIIGIEDVLFGFVIGGLGAVLYEVVFRKKIKARKESDRERTSSNLRWFYLLMIVLFISLALFFVFGANTFVSSIVSLLAVTSYMLYKRPDLIRDALGSGLLLLGAAIIVYYVVSYLTPGWIDAFWTFSNTPKIMILSLPIDDFVWYFLAGAFIGPLYEFAHGYKLEDVR